jgi:PadR family transcriptional regulator, regulatory protein PadR
MPRSRRPSAQTSSVLAALAAAASEWRYGYELAVETGLQSGSLYPILVRLSERAILESRWETDVPAGRPPRHLYRLTASGLEYATAHAPSPSASPGRRAQLRSAS